jgi:hypothetical protein
MRQEEGRRKEEGRRWWVVVLSSWGFRVCWGRAFAPDLGIEDILQSAFAQHP